MTLVPAVIFCNLPDLDSQLMPVSVSQVHMAMWCRRYMSRASVHPVYVPRPGGTAAVHSALF